MTTETPILPREDLEKFIAFLNSDKLPKELLPYGAAAALCLGTGRRLGEILKLQKCDVFSAGGNPLQRISFFEAVKRNGKIVGKKKISIIFPWVKLGNPVCRWHNSRKRSSQPALFTSRTQPPRGKYSAYLREITRLAGIEPGKINFETLRKNAPILRISEAIALLENFETFRVINARRLRVNSISEAIALLEMENLLPRLRNIAAFLNK